MRVIQLLRKASDNLEKDNSRSEGLEQRIFVVEGGDDDVEELWGEHHGTINV